MKKRNQCPHLTSTIRQGGCVVNVGCLGSIDVDHVKPYGSGGRDYIEYDGNYCLNLMGLCRKHHQEKGQVGYGKMISKYKNYHDWLLKHNRIDIIERSKK